MAVAAAAKPGDLELLMDVSGRVPRFIRSDSGKLRQVLTNLVGNALKYTDQGTVTVRLDARPEGGSASLVLIFEVEDTGKAPINLTRDSAFDDTQPAFSPDSAHVAFRSERDGGGIFVMGATGDALPTGRCSERLIGTASSIRLACGARQWLSSSNAAQERRGWTLRSTRVTV
jgi:hypothetical protein